MQKLLKKIFTNDTFFLLSVVIASVCALFYYISNLIIWPDYVIYTHFYLIYLLCIITLFVSYKLHSKNVMKGMMGAILMLVLTEALMELEYAEMELDVYASIAYLVLAVIMFVNHFIINSEHHSRPVNIMINQIAVVLFAIVSIVWDILWIPYCRNGVDIASQFCSAILFAGLCISIVCIESRLDSYRVNREAAGWTEEKGYPDGYVHECDKKHK